MDITTQKQDIRKSFLEKRSHLFIQRREDAKKQLIKTLLPKLEPFQSILSFHSFKSELPTHELNHHLLQNKKLCLPAIINNQIVALEITNLNHLINFGRMLQPDPTFYKKASIDLVLVPAVVFDKRGFRLGYGQGYYDRFLAMQTAVTIGIGFKEQLYSKNLPTEKHDIAVKQVLLF